MQSDIVQRLNDCPDINHARLSPIEERETEYVVPASVKFAVIAEITRLTEALRAAEEREKGLREAGGRQCDNMAFVLNHFDIPGHWYGKLLAQLETDRQALAGAKP